MSPMRAKRSGGVVTHDAEPPFRELVERVRDRLRRPGRFDTDVADLREPVHRGAAGLHPRRRDGRHRLVGPRAAPGRSRARVFAEWSRCDETGAPYTGEYRMIAADGRVVWIRDEAILLRDENGTPLHWQGVMLDVTATKQASDGLERALELERQATEELRRADEIEDDVPHRGVARHPPLSAILGNALTLEGGDRLGITDEEKKQLIHSLAAKARRLNAIVTDLLDTERLARGVMEPKLQEIAVGRLVSLLVWDSEAMAGRQVHVDTRSVSAWVDPQMVSHIVENLLTNAARHTPATSQVWVRVMPNGDEVLIVVEDDGPIGGGAPQVGVRTVRARTDDVRAQPGRGGRALLVSRFAELHGGRAWVEERDGGGASFRVSIPRGDPEVVPEGAVVVEGAER